MLPRELGQRIRHRRERRGLRQQDIAHALQVSPQAVSKWERGENAPDIMVLGALARLLGVSTDYLLGNTEPDRDVFEATVFVSCIDGAYLKSLGMNPRDFAAWANGIFLQITEAALRYEGVPIKYLGDEFLCFFSGADHPCRALAAVRLAKSLAAEREALKVGLSSGELYFGKMGHPDYAHLDIMGETVNLGFLTMRWAQSHSKSGMAVTASVTRHAADQMVGKPPGFVIGKKRRIRFMGIDHPVEIHELQLV